MSRPFAQGLFAFLRRRISQSHARTSAVLFDEFDSGRFKASPNHIKCGSTWFMRIGLQLADGHDADPSLLRELLLAPIE
jgi:hypothetical protein